MDTSDQIMYAACWLVLMLYIVSTLVVFIRQTCIGCAAAFVFACLLWLDLSLFNAWFFLPSFVYHVREIDLHVDNVTGLFQAIVTSKAAQDFYLMILGSLGSWLAVFNAASMLQTDGRMAMSRHEYGKFSRYTIEYAYRMCDYLDIGNDDTIILPSTNPTNGYQNEKSVWKIESLP